MTRQINQQPNMGRGLFTGTKKWPFLLPGVCLFCLFSAFFAMNRPRSLCSVTCVKGKQNFDFNCRHVILSQSGYTVYSISSPVHYNGFEVLNNVLLLVVRQKTDKPLQYKTLKLHPRIRSCIPLTHSLSFQSGLPFLESIFFSRYEYQHQ